MGLGRNAQSPNTRVSDPRAFIIYKILINLSIVNY
jgi:hypothetical protein